MNHAVVAAARILSNDHNGCRSVYAEQFCEQGGILIGIGISGKQVGKQIVFHPLHEKRADRQE